MTIYSSISISGVELLDVYDYTISKSISENNSSSNFEANLDNFIGKNGSLFNVGNEVIIKADKDVNPPTSILFRGILEDISYTGRNMEENMKLSGRDYTARLMDRTVEPEVYTNQEIGSIVKDIMSKYGGDVSYSGVQNTTTTLDRISFNHKPVYDAIKQLSDLAGNYMFYISNNKDLIFSSKSVINSGYTFNSGNTTYASFKEQRDTIFNQIWVYGDRYLDGFRETFTAGSPLGGSIFTLTYKPHNTEVSVSGATIQPGAIEGISLVPSSGTKYLVNYDDRKIVFTSGTDLGLNIPSSGNQVIINYKRSLPIVKVGDNESSKSQYGTRVKVIVDKDIKDPSTAENIMQQELAKYSFPIKEGRLKIKSVSDVTPGTTCIVNLPYQNILNQNYDIIEANYNFSKKTNLSEEVLTLRVNKRINDVTDVLKQALLDIKKLQGNDISDSDIITRYQTTTGSINVRQSGCLIYVKSIAGSNLIYNSPTFGLYDIYKYAGAGTLSWILGNVNQSILGNNVLGNLNGNFQLVWSGGYF